KRFPAGKFLRRAGAALVQLQLEPTFVVLVLRLEKHRRLRGVDKDRELQPRADFEDLIEAWIVDMHALAFTVFQFHAEVLEYFQTLSSVFGVLLQLRRGARGVTGGVQV